ncbi:pentapeptide repeat-containing protein [bacterium]|nr:pentapeptide repeat-containing protein [bacterium]
MRREKSVFTKLIYSLLLVGILGLNLYFFLVGMPSEYYSQIYVGALGALLLYLGIEYFLPARFKAKNETTEATPKIARKKNTSNRSIEEAPLEIQEMLENPAESDLQTQHARQAALAELRSTNLQNADLFDINLEEVNLEEANLSGANLWSSNLKNGNLRNADLEGANLFEAHLANVDFAGANLRRTKLWEANLDNANLTGANLQEADLRGAKLRNACLPKENLEKSKYNNRTTLPDWLTPETCKQLGMVFELD